MVAGQPSSSRNDEKWWRAGFSIFSVILSPKQISDRLGLEPSRIHEKGQPRGARRKDRSISPSVVWKDYAWHLNCPLKRDHDLREHIIWLLDVLEPRAEILRSLVPDCTLIRFFCGFSSTNGQGGFGLDPVTLGRISRLGFNLIFDLYPPSNADKNYEEAEGNGLLDSSSNQHDRLQ
jgi:hypothetical protein